MRDLQFAFRVLRKAPIFTITAVLTLAFCIGANTAIYTVVDRMLLRPLPYPDADRLAAVTRHVEGPGVSGDQIGQNGRTWQLLHDSATKIDVAATGGTMGVNLVAGGRAEYVIQRRVTAGFFRVLGVRLARGREFADDEDRAGGPQALVLSHAMWVSAFGADPSIVGRSVTLRGEPHTVVGVLPPDFGYSEHVDVWTPLRPGTRGEGGGENYEILARVRSGATWGEAQGELASIGAPLMRDMYRAPDRTVRLGLIPLQRGLTEQVRLPLFVLLAAVATVLVIGCVNIAGLLLARGAVRAPELATRMALGAGRRAIVRQLLVESAVLAVCGGACGIALGYGLLQVLASYTVDVFGRQPFTLDARVFAITGSVSLFSSIMFGLLPAFHASRVDIRAAMIESGGTAVAGGASGWPRRLLVIAEVALGVVLLVGAGLLVRTLAYLTQLKPGFDGTNVMTASLSLQDARYASADRINRLLDESLDRIRAIPGVETAAVCLTLPYERALNLGWRFVGGSGPSTPINVTYVTPEYFQTFRIPTQRGRAFTSADSATALRVAVVNQAFVQRYSRDQEPIGRQIMIGNTAATIVGTVGDILQRVSFGSFGPVAAIPGAYVPASQFPTPMFGLVHTWFSPSWVVRSSGQLAGLAADMQRRLQSVDRELPFAKFRTVADLRAEAVAGQRAETILFGSLAALAILLAAIGLYGLIASSVGERTRDLGIRLALGASPYGVAGSAARPGLVLGIVGVAIGLLLARIGADAMRSLVWGVTATDPATFALAAAIVLLVTLVATVVPAIRIVRLNPMKALRSP